MRTALNRLSAQDRQIAGLMMGGTASIAGVALLGMGLLPVLGVIALVKKYTGKTISSYWADIILGLSAAGVLALCVYLGLGVLSSGVIAALVSATTKAL
jgi:hypothetical protein